MFKRQDSDIFGTKNAPVAHRIVNDTPTDPNAPFKIKMETQYNTYKQKVQKNQFRHTITQPNSMGTSQVMQKAQFDQDFHHYRKDLDMQSSIFYPPTHIASSRVSQLSSQSNFRPNAQDYYNQDFKKKQTLSRQYKNIPQNSQHFRGNSSHLFGFDDRVNQNQQSTPVMPLIPHQMKWDQYDSVRYQGNSKKGLDDKQSCFGSLMNSEIAESVSTVFQNPKKQPQSFPIKQNPESQLPIPNQAFLKKPKQSSIKQNRQIQSNIQKQGVEIKILNGWHAKHLQGLSKQCKLNGTNLLKLEITDTGKGTMVLQKSKRWECVTDWLRKDAKLKLRILTD